MLEPAVFGKWKKTTPPHVCGGVIRSDPTEESGDRGLAGESEHGLVGPDHMIFAN